MAYNPRMSIIPPGQQQSRTQRTQRSKREEIKATMRLPDHEIVGCITDIGIAFTLADLQKPHANQVQKIFEWFAELLLNATRETVAPAMRAAARDTAGDALGDQLFPPDCADLMGFYVSLRRLLLKCGLEDDEFSFADLYRPTHARLVDIFSHIINFVRFRESQTNTIDEHFNRGEQVKARIQELYAVNDNLGARHDEMHGNLSQSQALVAEKTKRNEAIKKKLLELRRSQEQVATKMEETKARKTQLTKQLEDRTAQKLAVRHECAKLRPYVQQSAAALQVSLTELSNALAADKAHIDALDRRARALQTSADSFAVVAADVAQCSKLLDEIALELQKEEDENARKTKLKDTLQDRRKDAQDAERAEALLQRQLAKWVERTEKLREQAHAKAQDANRKMEELGDVHKKLKQERGEKGNDIEKRKVRIEQTEKKMQDLKDAIEKEVHDSHDEYLKMEAHIKLYITEMEQAIPADE